LDGLKERATAIKTELQALLIAYRDPRTPWLARVWVLLVLAYALSPIDLIPDFIPLIGYLDDLVLLPLGIALAIRLIPAEVLDEARQKAGQSRAGRMGWVGAGLIVLAWLLIAGTLVFVVFRFWK